MRHLTSVSSWLSGKESDLAPDDGKVKEIASNYFSSETNKIAENVERAEFDLQKVNFDTIVVTGLSGLIVGSPLALKMNKHLLIVRKSDEGHHGSFRAEGWLGRRWLFVDDFISTGNTFNKVAEAVEKICQGRWYKFDDSHWTDMEWDTHCVGLYEYEKRDHRPNDKRFKSSDDRPYDVSNRSYQKINWDEVR